MENQVSIGMVTYNRLGLTKRAIKSITEKTKYPYKLIVVDNNSSDGTQEFLKEEYNNGNIHTLYLLPQNIGVAKASNLAWITYPNFKYYVKFDNDIVIHIDNWLKDMVTIIENVPKIGMLGYNVEVNPWNNIKKFNGHEVRLKFKGNLGGACIIIPERVRKILGYWCEDYGLYSEEDADYGFRIRKSKLFNCYMLNNDAATHCNMSSIPLKEKIYQKAKQYANWKNKQRKEGLKKLSGNLKSYNTTKNLYINTSMSVNKYKKYLYLGK